MANDKLKLGFRFGPAHEGPVVYDVDSGRELDKRCIMQPIEIEGISQVGELPHVVIRIPLQSFEVVQKE